VLQLDGKEMFAEEIRLLPTECGGCRVGSDDGYFLFARGTEYLSTAADHWTASTEEVENCYWQAVSSLVRSPAADCSDVLLPFLFAAWQSSVEHSVAVSAARHRCLYLENGQSTLAIMKHWRSWETMARELLYDYTDHMAECSSCLVRVALSQRQSDALKLSFLQDQWEIEAEHMQRSLHAMRQLLAEEQRRRAAAEREVSR
jgi:signal transduction histidine kinase